MATAKKYTCRRYLLNINISETKTPANYKIHSLIVDKSLIPRIFVPIPIYCFYSLQSAHTDFHWGKAYYRPEPLVRLPYSAVLALAVPD
jgi:hypothetical protein